LSEEQEAVRDLGRAIALDVIYPAAREAEKARAVPPSVWETVFDTGLTVPVSDTHGGGGVPDAVTQCVAAEALGYGDAGIALAALWSGAAALMIGTCGDAAQQREVLPRLACDSGSRGAIAMYEGFGRSPSQYQTTFTVIGDSWQINGEKVAVPHAAEADPLIVVGVEDGSSRPIAAIVDRATPGLTISPDGRHLALDAVPTSTITFRDVGVPHAKILAAYQDPIAVQQSVDRVRLILAAVNIGCAQRALEYASQYALDRVAFEKPIAAFQGVSFLLADASMRIQAARLDTYHAATMIDKALPSEDAVSSAVNYAGVAATQGTRDCLQVLGGHGFITDHPVELWYRSAAAMSAIDFDPLRSSFEPAL
jgi:alkylation response protein AidB-like acyl-CoA dehydrogenase